jgi:hypothetical protein
MWPIFRSIYRIFKIFGFDAKAFINLKYYPKFRKQKKEFLAQGGNISKSFLNLNDYKENAGENKGHYFHQDLLVASYIFKNNPLRHIDVGSRIDGFILAVASFREIEVIDIRKLPSSAHKNIKFIQADLMSSIKIGQADSLSCLHALEHFGLGRYGDPIDIDGHLKGIKNLFELVKPKGLMYISVPIGLKDEVIFNSHRIFHPKSILQHKEIKEKMNLVRFDWVDDYGNVNIDSNVENAIGKTKYGNGIYTFTKKEF